MSSINQFIRPNKREKEQARVPGKAVSSKENLNLKDSFGFTSHAKVDRGEVRFCTDKRRPLAPTTPLLHHWLTYFRASLDWLLF
jgi:hypothetical protein